jgi:ABC-2 type transport system permease protein
MKTFKKYVALYWAFFRASLTADLEFRANFTTKIITDIFWYAAQILGFEMLYNFTDQIGSWNRAEMRVFLGVLFTVDAIFMVVFSTNLDFFSDSVRKGNLDLLLTKPINSQFMISFQRASTAHIGNFVLAIAWLGWALYQFEGFQWWRVLWLLITVPCGVAVFYSLRFAFSVTAVIFTRADNLQYLWYHLYKLGMRPDNIYSAPLKYLVLTLVPVGIIGSVPARVLLGTGDSSLVIYTILIAGICLYLSKKFWAYCLTFYTSASS